MTERAIEAAARPLRWKMADAISFAVTGTYSHASDYLVEADAALSVIAALAEDEAAVEKIGKAANVAWHKWLSDSMNTTTSLDAIGSPAQACGRAAIRAMGE